jgi:transposase
MMMSYQPMTLAGLAAQIARHTDVKVRWKYVWEFLEEYRWEPAERQPRLLEGEAPPTYEEQWDALLAAIAEHLTAQLDQAPPA